MLHYTTKNPDTIIAYLNNIVAQGRAKSGIHLKHASSSDPWTININNTAFYTSCEPYDKLRAVLAVGKVWR